MFDIATDRGKAQYQAEMIRLQQRLEVPFAKGVAPIIRRAWELAADGVEHGLTDFNSRVDSTRFALNSFLQGQYKRIAAVFGDEAFRKLEESEGKKQDSMRARYWQEIDKWTRTEAASKVTQINGTTRSQIARVLGRGLREGISNEQIAKNIRSVGTISSKMRSRRIARTETHTASVNAVNEATKSTGMEFTREWISSIDDRIRGKDPKDQFNHIVANGETVGMEEPFRATGESLRYPGDPKGSPGNIINCRCVLLYHRKKMVEVEKEPGVADESEAYLFGNTAADWASTNSDKVWDFDIGYQIEHYGINKWDANTEIGKVNLLKSAISDVGAMAEKKMLYKEFSQDAIKYMKDLATDDFPGQSPILSAAASFGRTGKWVHTGDYSVVGLMAENSPKKLFAMLGPGGPEVGAEIAEMYDISCGLQRAWMKKQGIKSFEIYRGMRLETAMADTIIEKGSFAEFNGSFWSTNESHAALYAKGPVDSELKGIVVKRIIKVDDIQAYYGGHAILGYESGLTTYGGGRVKVKVVQTFGGLPEKVAAVANALPKEYRKLYIDSEREYFEFFEELKRKNITSDITGDLTKEQKWRSALRDKIGSSGMTDIYGAVDRWQVTTQAEFPMALKYRASEVEKVGKMLYSRDFLRYSSPEKVAKIAKVFDEQYIKLRAFNQAYMRSHNINRVTLFRGTDGQTGREVAKRIKKDVLKGKVTKGVFVEDAPLAGYTADMDLAAGFGHRSGGVTAGTSFDAKDIFLHEDLMWKVTGRHGDEREFIVFGGRRWFSMSRVTYYDVPL